jgi:tRNA threonylcarbamoyladenosine biosynthesis protein TsaE
MTDQPRRILENLGLEAMRDLGKKLGRLLARGDWLLLRGELGAGKTTLAMAIAEGCGYKGSVTSPTFALIHEYVPADPPLRHADLFRAERSEDIAEMLLEGAENWATLVEWPDRLGDWMPEQFLEARISIASANLRSVELVPYGERPREIVELLGGIS